MKLKWSNALVLVLLTCTSMSQAGTVTTRSAPATMEVSLRIVEACDIQTSASAGAQVECRHGSPYLIQAEAEPRAGASTGAAELLTVAF